MRTLASRYEMSNVALAKRCKRLKVPVPARGFWAKKSAGKLVKATPLPKLPVTPLPQDHIATFYINQATPVSTQIPALIQGQIEFELAPENLIVVSDSLRSPHPLVRRTRDALKGNAGFTGVLYNFQEPYLDVQVSRASLQRALLIIDALVKAFEKREWKVSMWTQAASDDRKRYVTVIGQRVPFGIREKIKKVAYPQGWKQTTAYERQRRQDVPSGKLALVLRSHWGNSVEQSWSDTDNLKVEDCLNDFVVGVVERAYDDLLWDAQREDAERGWQAAAARREADQRRQAIQLARIATLERQAADFQKSQTIAVFIGEISTAAEAATLSNAERIHVAEWLSWVEAHAASLNPLRRPLMEVVGADETEK